jgi:hypothetical protein
MGNPPGQKTRPMCSLNLPQSHDGHLPLISANHYVVLSCHRNRTPEAKTSIQTLVN